MLKNLVIITLLLALTVVSMGAYTRLKDAGLGCPDWPGCYGQLSVPDTHEEISRANASYPERPVESHKAWAEMIHRYIASILGLLIVCILLLSIKQYRQQPSTPILLPLILVGLVIFQGMLGMWTVTLKLYPPVVMGHLLGGFATLSMLWLLFLKLRALPTTPPTPTKSETLLHPRITSFLKNYKKTKGVALVALCILVLQIALGGWTSSNYAAIACTEFPQCQDQWLSLENLKEAFIIAPVHTANFEYGLHLTPESKQTIHMIHRIGAIIVSFALILTAVYALRNSKQTSTRRTAFALIALLVLQISLGLSNILLMLPLAIAVAHNVVALLLLLTLITLVVSLQGEKSHG